MKIKKSYTPKFKGDTEQLNDMRCFFKRLRRLPDEAYCTMIVRAIIEEDKFKEMKIISGDIDWEDLAIQARITEQWIKEIENGGDRNKYDLAVLEELTHAIYKGAKESGYNYMYGLSEYIAGELIICMAADTAKQLKDMTEREMEHLIKQITDDDKLGDAFDHGTLCDMSARGNSSIIKPVVRELIAYAAREAK